MLTIDEAIAHAREVANTQEEKVVYAYKMA